MCLLWENLWQAQFLTLSIGRQFLMGLSCLCLLYKGRYILPFIMDYLFRDFSIVNNTERWAVSLSGAKACMPIIKHLSFLNSRFLSLIQAIGINLGSIPWLLCDLKKGLMPVCWCSCCLLVIIKSFVFISGICILQVSMKSWPTNIIRK